jgi:spore coat polysaccharide biosynthesis protein SpsF
MEVGQLDKSVGFIIQARMNSTRLPGKVLMPLPFLHEKSMLQHQVETLNSLGGEIVVATSNKSESDPIAQFCLDNNIECFRGDEHNVFSRFQAIQKEKKFAHILRFTADNPLVDPLKLRDFYKTYVEKGLDYGYSEGMPLGMNFEIFQGSCLERVEALIESDSDLEHVTPAIRRNGMFKRESIKLADLSYHRFTVDTLMDYSFMSHVYQLKEKYKLDGLELVELICSEFNWLFGLNSDVLQSGQALAPEDKVYKSIKLLERFGHEDTIELFQSLGENK